MQKECETSSQILVRERRSGMQNMAARKGFTLIELMVVVAIIAIISGLLIPKLLSMVDKSRELAEETSLPETETPIQERRDTQPQGVPPVIESADMHITLVSASHRIGMDVYMRYEVHCQGKLIFRRAAEDANPLLLTIPLPEGRAEARDVRLTLTRMSDSTTWEPDNLEYQGQRLYWRGELAENERMMAEVNFVALGREQFEYRLPPARQLRSLHLVVELAGAGSPNIPDHALQPTEANVQHFTWSFNNLVTDRAIIIEIPGALSPLGRVLLLVRLVAIAVLLFGIGLWYLGEQVHPGHLKNFRWGHFLLLALTYSLYFVIFAVISFQENIGSWLAMGIAAVFSWPLLLLHVTRIIDFKFAYSRALPLVVFTLGLVINGVYGGIVRDYVFIAAAIFVIAYLTLTYEKWEQGRVKYREQQRAKREKRIEAIRAKLLSGVQQIIDACQVADMQAEHALEISEHPELETERYALVQKRQPVPDLLKQYQELSKRLPELGTAADEFDHTWYDSFEQEIEHFDREAQKILDALSNTIQALNKQKRSLRTKHADQEVYCIACGHHAPPSPYCQECGTVRGKLLTCRECGKQLMLPIHLLAEDLEPPKFYCQQCGEQFQRVL